MFVSMIVIRNYYQRGIRQLPRRRPALALRHRRPGDAAGAREDGRGPDAALPGPAILDYSVLYCIILSHIISCV